MAFIMYTAACKREKGQGSWACDIASVNISAAVKRREQNTDFHKVLHFKGQISMLPQVFFFSFPPIFFIFFVFCYSFSFLHFSFVSEGLDIHSLVKALAGEEHQGFLDTIKPLKACAHDSLSNTWYLAHIIHIPLEGTVASKSRYRFWLVFVYE